jgi:hypothetical protein
MPKQCETKQPTRVDMPLSRKSFLLICSEITGYSGFELESTGLVDTYYQLLPRILGPQFTEEFAKSIDDVLVTGPDTPERQAAVNRVLGPPSPFWPVISALVSLWYLGTWKQLPDSWYGAVGLALPGQSDAGRTHVPSQLGYIEQLSYKTANAHPPGAKPTGFGSWGWKPVV